MNLPLWSIEPASPNEDTRKAFVESLADPVEPTKPLDRECYVSHSTADSAAERSRLTPGDEFEELINS